MALNDVHDRVQLGEMRDKYEVIRPFSCNIVRTVMEPELVSGMQEIFKQQCKDLHLETPDEIDNSYGLAGNNAREFTINEEMLGTETTPLLTSCLADLCSQYYVSTIIVEWRFKKGVFTPKHVEIVEQHLKEMAISVNIQNVWGNISIAGDFNPPHTHSGHVSGVAYFQMPDDIEREWLLEDHDPSAGMINFWDGRSQTLSLASFKVKPVVGDIYCFPNWLNHSVWPFRSSGQRWSISYNCEVFNKNNDLRLDEMEKAELKNEKRKLLKALEDAG
jgi:hypothetical protein